MTMAVTAIAMIGAMGLAIDLGHIFIVKNETQAYVDAAALAVYRDSGIDRVLLEVPDKGRDEVMRVLDKITPLLKS